MSITLCLAIERFVLFCCSNLAFALLGNGLVNLLPNMTYEDYVLTMILEPLGMTMTGFNYTKRLEI